MRDLRFTGVTPEGDLLLADTDGDPYRVAADSRLVEALGVPAGPVATVQVLRAVPEAPRQEPPAVETATSPAESPVENSVAAPADDLPEEHEATVSALLPGRPAHPATASGADDGVSGSIPEAPDVVEVIEVVRVLPSTAVAPAPGRPTAPALRPRDIQARIRAGASVEDVARESGMDPDRVGRYAGPPLAERAYIAEKARATEIRRHDGGQTLEDAVVARLVLRGSDASDLVWDSWRRDDGRWTITLEFADGEAAWLFDPEGRSLVAADDQAHTLTGSGPAPDVERPRLLSVEEPRPARVRPADDPLRREQPAAPPPAATRPASIPTASTPSASTPTTSTPTTSARPEQAPPPARQPVVTAPPSDRSYDDLASAMRAGSDRASRPASPAAPAVPREVDVVDAVEELDVADDVDEVDEVDQLSGVERFDEFDGVDPLDLPVEVDAADHLEDIGDPDTDTVDGPMDPQPKDPQPTDPKPTAARPAATRSTGKGRKSKRASVPSWDEIVFGARPDDST